MTWRRSDGTDKQRRKRAEQNRGTRRGRGKNVLRFAACHALQISREMRGSEMKRTEMELGMVEGLQQLEAQGTNFGDGLIETQSVS